MNNKQQRNNFIIKCVSLRHDIKFQYYYKNMPSATWFNYQECLNKHPYLFMVNEKILRTSIETKDMSEFRIDIDTKDELGNKSLKLSIIESLNIIDILKEHNIKHSLYYSGGNGMHIHFLFTFLNMPTIENRKKFKLLIAEQLSILNLIDDAPLSPNTMFGSEGYQHRKTENYKIYIDTSKYNNLGNILRFIDENSHKIIINYDYFKEVNDLSKLNLDLNESYYSKNNNSSLIGSNSITPKKPLNNTKVSSYLITFIELYKEKGITSKHFYPLMVCKFLLSENLDQEQIKYYMTLFIEKSNCAFDKSLDNFIIDTSKLKDKRVFIYCEPNAERFYFTFNEFVNKNNQYMKILGGTY